MDTDSERGTAARYVYYLYCILESGTEAHRLLRERKVQGLEPGEPLFPIEESGLVAAVSRVPAAVFQEGPLNELLKELPRLAPFALRHDEAISALQTAADAIVPVSLGAVYRAPERVAALLRDQAGMLRPLLETLRGKQEWGLKVLKDGARLLEAAEAASGELRRLAQEASRSSPGRAYLLRKQRERLLSGEAERLGRESLDAIVQALASASCHVKVEELPDAQEGRLSLALKAAFLVETGAVEAFRSAADELQAAYSALGLQLEVSGPWAPYSFVGEGRHGGVGLRSA